MLSIYTSEKHATQTCVNSYNLTHYTVRCRELNCVFDMQIDDLLGNPMCLGIIENLQAQGKPNPRQLLSAAITDAARLQGFLQPDGGLLFPRNVAIIAEMQAKT